MIFDVAFTEKLGFMLFQSDEMWRSAEVLATDCMSSVTVQASAKKAAAFGVLPSSYGPAFRFAISSRLVLYESLSGYRLSTRDTSRFCFEVLYGI